MYLINNQKGIALPMVILFSSVIILLGFSLAFIANSQSKMVSRVQTGEESMHFAEAGINRYIYHLNQDRFFYQTQESQDMTGVDIPFEDGYYRLSIQEPSIESPMVSIVSTGWHKNDPELTRTIEADVYKREFAQNVYCSNLETTGDGELVWWVRGDEVRGPLHTNGNLNIDGTGGFGTTGPTFDDSVTYSSGLTVRTGSEVFSQEHGEPTQVVPLVFPASNSQLITRAQHAEGLYLEGRTSIMLLGNQIRYNNRGNVETINIPTNGVIYVDGTQGSKWDYDTGNVFISGTLEGRLTIAAANNIYITAWDPTDMSGIPSGNGTGGLKYQNDNVTESTNLSNDMLGLIAEGSIRILHYNWPRDSQANPRWNGIVAPDNITIHAVLFAINESFGFEYYDYNNPRGTINLKGSIVQNYRGAVGTFYTGGDLASGYLKNYVHDPRLSYDTPPHFLEPLNSGWEIRAWREY